LSPARGLRCWERGIAGHFVTAVECDGAPILIDPFDKGRALTHEEAHERMRQTLGEEIEWSEELLEPVSNLHWLTRLLQNLLHISAPTVNTTTSPRCWKW